MDSMDFASSNLIMIYLLGVVIIAASFGSGAAILSSLLSVVAFDFFFVPPRLTFAVADSQYLITFTVMLAVAILVSSLTARLWRQAQDANERERRTAALYAMSGELSHARGLDKLLDIIVRHVTEIFESDVVAFLPDRSGHLSIYAGNEAAFPMNARERAVAYWVLDLGRPAGLGTDTIPGAEGLYLPLNGTRGTVGVLGVRPVRAGRSLTPELLQWLEAFAAQAGLAIESDKFADLARQAEVNAEREKVRNALLTSVSHALKTPLSAIAGAASSLTEQKDRLEPAARHDLAQIINGEAARLNRLVANLLEMTGLESGSAKAKREPHRMEAVISRALARLEKQLSRHRVTTRTPPDLPMVPLDAILMEEVFVNLLENASEYSPPGSEIEIGATAAGGEVTVEVADRGPGIVPGDEERIFEEFYRRGGPDGNSAAGLGLTICRTVVEAHGGRIWAENRPGGGASFRFTLPVDL